MIKVETVENGTKVEMEGTVMDLMADTVQIVDALVTAISKRNGTPQEIIREAILYGIRDFWYGKER